MLTGHYQHKDLGIEGIDILVADVNDEASIEAMCSKTKVLMDVVGPVSSS